MAFRWTAVLGVVLLQGCGGRAQSDGGVPEPPADGPSAIAGAINDGPTAGSNHDGAGGKAGSGTASAGGGSTINPIDDESHASGAPLAAPSSAAIVWRSPAGGWKIGNWFWSSDRVRDVELSPIEPPRDGSTQARHVSGAGFPSGVVLWLELDHLQRRPVDLSSYAGLTFWTRLSSTSGKLDVLLNDGSTNVTAWGESPPASSLSVAVGGGWQQVTLSFEDFGVPQPQAVSIDFHVGDGGGSFDLWIDDLAFFCAGPCP